MRINRAIFQIAAGMAIAILFAGCVCAQQNTGMPPIENAKLETRTVSGSLDATFQSITAQADKPEWVGYAVPEIAGDRSNCCWNNSDGHCGKCNLEKEHDSISGAKSENHTVELEGARQLTVLYRLEGKRVMKIRIASEDCTLDAGGLAFVWLNGVKPAESVALLEQFVHAGDFGDRSERKVNHEALTAIALHGDAAADRAMESFVAPNQPEELRKQAVFWMGAGRGKTGFAALERLAKNDPSTEVRAQVAFAFSVSQEPGAIDEMIRMAHDDSSPHVRGQAIFWIAQKAGKKAASTITGAIENDPDTDVKKKAVFALSQLPKDEGVPKLIEVAQNNRNPEVRKQAMFWLGESHDPRALQFFEKVLSQ